MSHSPLWCLSLSQLQFILDSSKSAQSDEPNPIILMLIHTYRNSEGRDACKTYVPTHNACVFTHTNHIPHKTEAEEADLNIHNTYTVL